MATRRNIRAREAQLGFEAIAIEGSLLSPEWLSKVAQVAADLQSEADYGVPKGLNLREEIGRYWRIAQAHWREFAAGLTSSVDRTALAERFATSLLRESFGFTSLARVAAPVLSERSYPLGHAALGLRVPVVIAPAASGIDALSPTFGDEGRRRSAFGLAQEYLNAAEGAVWGITTDGSTLRILRDNASLTRPAWIEADLARIFTEERYADFAALWLLLHETRFGREGQPANECALEAWREAGRKEGTRAREHLRKGVEEALIALGQGFLSHPDNQALRSALQDGSLSTRDYFSQLLRLVYRLIFLLTVEERNLLHAQQVSGDSSVVNGGSTPPTNHNPPRTIYQQGYSIRRLADRSVKRSAHDRFSDLWDSAKVVLRGLAGGEPRLGLPALAGIFAKNQCSALDAARLENRALLLALFKLAWLRADGALARVNWRDMGPEELGSVYESLLELVPQANVERRQFGFASGDETKGNARKTTGSYYTPDSLVQVLLDSALEPVIEQVVNGQWRLARGDFESEQERQSALQAVADALLPTTHQPAPTAHHSPLAAHQLWDSTPLTTRHSLLTAAALLRLSIVDPACGSGHFLLAAARRLAAHVARLQANGTPSGAEYRHALRQVVGKCIYGVDLNLMAVELCKVSLWMEAVEPGLPLTFLNSHIQHGNALLGTTPELMSKGVPDAAWEPIEGDDRKVASALKKRNKQGASGQRSLDTLWTSQADTGAQAVTKAVNELEAASDTDASELAGKEAKWEGILTSQEYRQQRFVADAWCAAFVWPKQVGPLAEVAPTNELWRQLRDGQGRPPELTNKTVEELAQQYRFFHWHLQYPQVFAKGGFDVVLGNPPWEKVKLLELEFFASRSNEIAEAPNASLRKKLIAILPTASPQLWREWCDASRKAEAESHYFRQSGRYPLCAGGDVNTYALFAEHNRALLGPSGRAGFIVPTGIATDDTTKEFFASLVEADQLATLFDFQSGPGLFGEIGHARFKFSLLTVVRGIKRLTARLCFYARSTSDLSDPERVYSLGPNDFNLVNPNTRTCPTFRTRRDADLNLALYRRAGVLWREHDETNANPWGVRFMTMFHMTNDSGLFRTATELTNAGHREVGNRFTDPTGVHVPLFEAKMVHHFDHRFGDYADKAAGSLDTQLPDIPPQRLQRPDYQPVARYWVGLADVAARLEGRWSHDWLLGWRDITNSTNERTVIASLIPRVAVGNTTPLMMVDREPPMIACLYGCLCSFALDYAARQKVGGTHLNFLQLKQLPVLPPPVFTSEIAWDLKSSVREWLLPRIVELTYTAWDLEPFARDVGFDGPPFRWDAERRFLLRCELDAAFFHLYGLNREDTAYVMDTFPIVRKHDEKAYREYRTKRVILEIHDALAESTRTGTTYKTRLNPAPASFRYVHRPRLPEGQRVSLAAPQKFLLSFIRAFLRQTGDGATFDLLDSVFHLLRHRAGHGDKFAAALGDDAKTWLTSFNDRLPNSEFLPFLKRLEADGWITADRRTGRMHLTQKFPPAPFDAWRNYDISAALRVITQQPEVVRLLLDQPDTPLASKEFLTMAVG